MSDEQASLVEDLIRSVRKGETVFDLEEGRLDVSYRELQPELPIQPDEPPIARAKARAHNFHEVGAFCEFLKRNADEGTAVILANMGTQEIIAVLDESDECDREIVSLAAIEHPMFRPWKQYLKNPTAVLEFAQFVMENRRAIVEPDGRELAMTFSQIKMSKAITVNQGQGTKSLNGVMVDVEIAGERQGVAVDLPETIIVELPLFLGSSTQSVEIDLLVTPKNPRSEDPTVMVYATASEVETQRVAAFEEMIATIREQTGLLVGLGEVKHRDWSVVEPVDGLGCY